jgi:hypothetical protein
VSLGLYVPLSLTILSILSSPESNHPYETFLRYCTERVSERQDLEFCVKSTVSVSSENLMEHEWQASQLGFEGERAEAFKSACAVARDIGVVVGEEILGEVVGAFNDVSRPGTGKVTAVERGPFGLGKGVVKVGDEKGGIDMGRLGAAEYMLTHWMSEPDDDSGVEVGWGIDENDR